MKIQQKPLVTVIFLALIASITGCADAIFATQMMGTGWQTGSYISYSSWDTGFGRSESVTEGADAKSFEVLDKHGYAKDKVSVYYRGGLVKSALADSFISLTRTYGKDSKNAFFEWQIVPEADSKTFEAISLEWARDKKDVYWQASAIGACDPASFHELEGDWSIDNKCVYNRTKKVVGADTASFKIINYWFAKDAHNVYDTVFNKPIEGADVGSFRLANSSCDVCARDKNRCYKNEKTVSCESYK